MSALPRIPSRPIPASSRSGASLLPVCWEQPPSSFGWPDGLDGAELHPSWPSTETCTWGGDGAAPSRVGHAEGCS